MDNKNISISNLGLTNVDVSDTLPNDIPINFPMKLDPIIPNINPNIPPINPIIPEFNKYIISISLFFAPIAFIVPISFVLSILK